MHPRTRKGGLSCFCMTNLYGVCCILNPCTLQWTLPKEREPYGRFTGWRELWDENIWPGCSVGTNLAQGLAFILSHAHTFLTLSSNLTCTDASPQMNFELPISREDGWWLTVPNMFKKYFLYEWMSICWMNKWVKRQIKWLPWDDGFPDAKICPTHHSFVKGGPFLPMEGGS